MVLKVKVISKPKKTKKGNNLYYVLTSDGDVVILVSSKVYNQNDYVEVNYSPRLIFDI